MSQRPRKILGRLSPSFVPVDEEEAPKFWAFVKAAFQDILQNRSLCQVSFEDLYGHVYSLAKDDNGRDKRVYSMTKDLVTEHLVKVGADVLACVDGGNILSTLSQAWANHHKCTSILNSIMARLNPICYDGRREYYDLTMHEMREFKERVIPEGRVRNCLQVGMSSLQVVRQGERKYNNLKVRMRHAGCEVVDRYAVKSICHMLEVFSDKLFFRMKTLFVYKDDLETPYINVLREIYPRESQKLLEEVGISGYIKVVEALMSNDDEQAKKCSVNSSKDAVVDVMEEELISKHVKTFFETETSGVMHMIKTDHYEDLACMYKLLVRVQDGLKPMIESVSKCLREEGKAIIASHNSLENAASFVKDIFDLKNRFYHMLNRSFQNNISIKRAMDNDLKYILHLNSDSSKYITAFTDEMLEKGFEQVKGGVLKSLDHHFLQMLNQTWSEYYKNLLMIRDVARCMGDDYVQQNHPGNVFNCGLAAFRDQVRSEVRDHLRATLLDMLMRDRRGEVVDRLAITSACDMFLILKTDSFNMYRAVFEIPFAKQSVEFYKRESEKCLREGGVAMYLKVVADFIKREGERANGYIGSSLVKSLVGSMEEEFVSNHLIAIIEAQTDLLRSVDTHFLQTLIQIWDFYLPNVVDIRNILMQNDRDFEWHSRPDRIFKMGLEIFQNVVFADGHVRDLLSGTLLDMLTRDRRGEAVDRSAIKSSCQMMKALVRQGNDFYKDNFETPYLEQSAAFYQCKGQKLFEDNDVNKYIKGVTTLINEEVKRAHFYLSNSVVHLMEKELISKHMKSMLEMKNSGVVHMLKNKQFEDLYNMYKLFGRVPQGQKTMSEFIGNYITEEGKALIPAEDTRPNAVSLIQGLLDLWTLYCVFLEQSFENNKIFKNQIEHGFQNILNHSSKTPEYITVFIHYKVSRVVTEKTEQAIENELDIAVILLRLLREKDLFEQCYRRKLANRLLLNKSISDDLEKYVISKLKIECGLMLPSRLEGMLQDMTVSKTTMEDFKKEKQTGAVTCDIDLSVSVLTTGIWPLQIFSYQSTVPVAAMDAFQAFRNFYLNKHSGRRLLLHTQLGTADLEATFYENLDEVPAGPSASTCCPWCFKVFKPKLNKRIPKRKHIIRMSTSQMCILMLFNNSERLTYQEIMNETNIPDGKLVKELQSLTLGKTSQRLLIKEPNVEHIDSSDVFYVNDDFTSELHRVKIQPAAKADTVPERKEIRIKVDKERVYQIEATIVRIMKAKRKLQLNDLIIEVTKQLQSRFLPHPDAIKSRIEQLIERDYLAREPDDMNLYKYIV